MSFKTGAILYGDKNYLSYYINSSQGLLILFKLLIRLKYINKKLYLNTIRFFIIILFNLKNFVLFANVLLLIC